MAKTTVHVYRVDTICEDVIFRVEITHNGHTQWEGLDCEQMQSFIRKPNTEITYDEEFETEDYNIEQKLEELHCVEICSDDTDGEYDLYFHKVRARHGEVEYDGDGEFIRTYKSLKSAQKKALTLSKYTI